MCGICGKLQFDPSEWVDSALVEKMNASIVHRGPDDGGTYVRENIGLGNRRLAIIDLTPAGHQPMSNEDGSVWITFNGEIYNFPELRDKVIARGHRLRSHSDTETIIHLYEDFGVDCIQHLRGMFAFAIWDQPRQRLFLARDRVGKKPLVYAVTDNSLLFASELRALLQDPRVKREPNVEAIHHYLTYQYVPSPLTAFTGIYKLPPGHFLICERGAIRVERYWDLDYTPDWNLSEQEWIEQIRALLRESTRIRLISDVPLGAFLSGGIDSSAVVAMMSEFSAQPVKTFSIGFEEEAYDETRYARVVAQRFRTDHHEFVVKPSAMEVLPKLVWHYGEPYADSSAIPTFYLSKMAREHVTVALNGDGGDELFGGYERYVANRALSVMAKIPKPALGMLTHVAARLQETDHPRGWPRRVKRMAAAAALSPERRYGKLVCYFDNETKSQLYSRAMRERFNDCDSFQLLARMYAHAKTSDVAAQTFYADTMMYLPDDLLVKVDIASMAASLEGRSPLLDHQLMELAARIPSDMKLMGLGTKYIFKKAMEGILPREIIYRQKKGFGVPIGRWFRAELKDLAHQMLLDPRSLARGYFDPGFIARMLNDHVEGRVDHGPRIWALLNLELWHRTYIDRGDVSQPLSL